MKSLIVIFVLFVCGFAQQPSQNNFTRTSSKALLFSFSGLSNLNANTFNNGIGGKLYVNDQIAIYAGLIMDYQKITTPINPDTNEIGYDGENSSLNIGVNGGFEWHPVNQKVSPYLGAGFLFSFGSQKQFEGNKWYRYDSGTKYKMIFETTGIYLFEIFATGGVEFFITKELSLSAEYHLGYNYLSNGESKIKYEIVQGESITPPTWPSKKNTRVSSFGFTTSGFLTLAVYF